ncbi:MAG: thiamine-phosphate kinase [Syntrophobacteraceae bacterium]
MEDLKSKAFVGQIGEFALIDRIAAILPQSAAGVVKGIGDDVAVLDTSGPQYLIATCDTQVEGVHFIREVITAYQLGRRLAAINISDIAAAGGEPRWALVSLAIPKDIEVGYVEELYRGMGEQLELAGASVVGGNLSRIDSGLVLDLTLLGLVAPGHLMARSTAQSGDAVMLTGSVGESRAGLELIRRPKLVLSASAQKKLLDRHLCPQPRLSQGRLLARSGLVTSMIDVSDGVLSDLLHVCNSSGKGAEIDASGLHLSPDLCEAALAADADPLQWALSGGEDYELMFTTAPGAVQDIQKMLLEKTGVSCSQIGKITPGGGVSLRLADGSLVLPGLKGWDHFGGGL